MDLNSALTQLNAFSDLGGSIQLIDFIVALGLASLLSIVIAKTYQWSYRGVSFSPAFMHTLVITGVVIAAVMMIIGSNIARAFSLVGALSIIRYRNAVKDPRDVAFIFLTMGVGMACGTKFFVLGIVLAVISCVLIGLMSWLNFGQSGYLEKVIRISCPPFDRFEDSLRDALKSLSERITLLSTERVRGGAEVEVTFSMKVPENFTSDSLFKKLESVVPGARVEVLGSNHSLDL
jgi:uncharacterized membrane protein YhiD involved in acid resistance